MQQSVKRGILSYPKLSNLMKHFLFRTRHNHPENQSLLPGSML